MPFLVRQWTIENGLPQNRITCLKQTRDGYLWIVTWVGLVRFDGLKFTVFKREGSDGQLPGMKDDCINALMEDEDGTLWIATKQGIILYRDGKFQNLKIPEELVDERIWALCAAKKGGVWFCNDDYLVRYRDGSFTTIALEKNTGSKLKMAETSDGRLNVFNRGNWFTIAPERMEFETNDFGGAPQRSYRAVLYDRDDRFWVGTGDGLKLSDGKQQHIAENPVLATNAVNFLYRSADGEIWASVENFGLFCGAGSEFAMVDLIKGKIQPRVICMEEDHEGGLWVGTEMGLFRLQRPSVRTFTSHDGLSSDNVVSVCEDREGTR